MLKETLIISIFSCIVFYLPAMEFKVIGRVDREEYGDENTAYIEFKGTLEQTKTKVLWDARIVRKYKLPCNKIIDLGNFKGCITPMYANGSNRIIKHLSYHEASLLFTLLAGEFAEREWLCTYARAQEHQASLKQLSCTSNPLSFP